MNNYGGLFFIIRTGLTWQRPRHTKTTKLSDFCDLFYFVTKPTQANSAAPQPDESKSRSGKAQTNAAGVKASTRGHSKARDREFDLKTKFTGSVSGHEVEYVPCEGEITSKEMSAVVNLALRSNSQSTLSRLAMRFGESRRASH